MNHVPAQLLGRRCSRSCVSVKMRDEAMLHARGANGGAGGGGPPPQDAPGGDRPPRMRTRERGRERGAGRGTRGQYMTKTEVNKKKRRKKGNENKKKAR